MKRTTAAVDHFYVHQDGSGAPNPQQPTNNNGSNDNSKTTTISSAEDVHKEIVKDNELLRSNSNVTERIFNIKIDQTLCTMRVDTQLMIVDIPGINEADSSKKYKEYVQQNWDTFDCVIVIMDSIQGVNTQEQVELLKFVKQNNESIKKIPTIILGNKMDDLTDTDTTDLIKETRNKTIEIFGNHCSEESLQKVLALEKIKDEEHSTNEYAVSTVFIPISAKNAFVYRKASHVTVDTFCADEEIYDKIGKDEVGRQWTKKSLEEKVQLIRDIVNDPAQFKERLADTNFDTFLAILSYYIGGNEAQKTLLANQVEVSLKKLPEAVEKAESISQCIDTLYKQCKEVGRDTSDLSGHFWEQYDKCKNESIKSLADDFTHAACLVPFEELKKYHVLTTRLGWQKETKKTLQKMRDFINEYLNVVIEKEKEWSFETFSNSVCTFLEANRSATRKRKRLHEMKDEVSWKNLSPLDWETILTSLLLPMCEMEIYRDFGTKKIALEKLLMAFRMNYDPKIAPICSKKDVTIQNKQLYLEAARSMHDHKNVKKTLCKVKMPATLDNAFPLGSFIMGLYSVQSSGQKTVALNRILCGRVMHLECSDMGSNSRMVDSFDSSLL